MIQILRESILLGDCSPCFDFLIEAVKSGNLLSVVNQGPLLYELAYNSGLFDLADAIEMALDMVIVKDNQEAVVGNIQKLLIPVHLPVIKHYFSEVIYPYHEETIDLLRNDQRLSEVYKETAEQFHNDQQSAGEIVAKCANLLESTFHKSIQELCKSKDTIASRISQINKAIIAVKAQVNKQQEEEGQLNWLNYKVARMESAKQDLLKGIMATKQSHSDTTQKTFHSYYELLYRDKIIRYQSTQLKNFKEREKSDYIKLIKYLSTLSGIPPTTLDDNIVNIYDALEKEEEIDFAAARELLHNPDIIKPTFTRKDSML